jgi:YD repeat-containing protein
VASGPERLRSERIDATFTTTTDGNGHVTRLLYNGDGNVITKTEAFGTAQQRTTTYHYDYAPWPNFSTEIDEPSAAKAGAQKVTTLKDWVSLVAPEQLSQLPTISAGRNRPLL